MGAHLKTPRCPEIGCRRFVVDFRIVFRAPCGNVVLFCMSVPRSLFEQFGGHSLGVWGFENKQLVSGIAETKSLRKLELPWFHALFHAPFTASVEILI